MSRWKVECAYNGSGFSGWQSQLKKDSIQDTIEARLEAIFRAPIRIHGSGRTDAGVHALGQVFHFDAEWRHGTAKLAAALGSQLPDSIQIKSVREAEDAFHARLSATGKRYEYRLHVGDADPFVRPVAWCLFRPVDWKAVAQAAALLEGRRDFKAFSAYNGSDVPNTVRTLKRLSVARKGRSVRIVAEADGFLYKMVRSLVGALISVGEGRLTLEQLESILKSRERTSLVQTAPAQGLCLVKVHYGSRAK